MTEKNQEKKKKRSVSIIRQVMVVNSILTFVLLIVFISSFLFFNLDSAKQEEVYSDNVLQTVSKNIDKEAIRLEVLTSRCESDPSIVSATANKLTLNAFVDNCIAVSSKLAFLQSALPYAENVYTYVGSTEQFITLDNAVFSKPTFIKTIEPDLVQGEKLPDFSKIKQGGFYSYRNFSLYIQTVLDKGLMIIKLDGNKFCNLEMFFDTLPNMDFIVLNKSGGIFASSSDARPDLLSELDVSADFPQNVSFDGEMVTVTQKKLSESGFRLLLVQRPNRFNEQQVTLNLISIFVGLVVFITCILTIFLNKRIYIPLGNMTKKYGNQADKNEVQLISERMDTLIRENSKMTEQIEVQQDMHFSIALNAALKMQDSLEGDVKSSLQKHYGKFRMAVIAAQDQKGKCEGFFDETDAYLEQTLSCRTIQIDLFCHAYLIPARKSAREGREALLIAMEKHLNGNGMICAAGISDFFDSMSDLQQAFLQAQARMLSNPIPAEDNCFICVSDPPKAREAAKVISLEVQNTVAGYIMNGSKAEIENILQHVLFSDTNISLHDFIGLYNILAALLNIVLFSATAPVCVEALKSTISKINYNPHHMYNSILSDCINLNEVFCTGQTAFRYQITEHLQKHYDEPLNLESIADEFGITPVYLSTWFKRNIGINLSVYLSNLRMEKAKEILAQNINIKINELAVMVGIPNTPTFIRQFKNYTGTTPDQYRKMNLNN